MKNHNFENFDQNRIVSQNLTKIKIFQNFRNFWIILTRIDIFGRYLRKISIFSKISNKFDFGQNFKKFRFWSNFREISSLVKILDKFGKNSILVKIFEKVRFPSNFQKISVLDQLS